MLPGCPAAFPFKVRLSLASQPLACCVRLFLGGALFAGGQRLHPGFQRAAGPARVRRDRPGQRRHQGGPGTSPCAGNPVSIWSPFKPVPRRPNPNPGGTANRQARQSATSRLMEVYGPALLVASRHQMLVRPGVGGDAVWLRLRAGSGPGGVDPSLFASLVPAERLRGPGRASLQPRVGRRQSRWWAPCGRSRLSTSRVRCRCKLSRAPPGR